MSKFITIKMKTVGEIQAIINAIGTPNPLDLSTNKPASAALGRLNLPGRVYLQDLGIREVGYDRQRFKTGQALYIEPWDGVSPVINVADYLLGLQGAGHAVPAERGLNIFSQESANTVNFGRLRFIMTDEIQVSLEKGMMRTLIDRGVLEIQLQEDELARMEVDFTGADSHPIVVEHNRGKYPIVQVVSADLASAGDVADEFQYAGGGEPGAIAVYIKHIDENSFQVETTLTSGKIIALF